MIEKQSTFLLLEKQGSSQNVPSQTLSLIEIEMINMYFWDNLTIIWMKKIIKRQWSKWLLPYCCTLIFSLTIRKGLDSELEYRNHYGLYQNQINILQYLVALEGGVSSLYDGAIKEAKYRM